MKKVRLLLLFCLLASTGLMAQADTTSTGQRDSVNLILKSLAEQGMTGNVRIIPHDERILDLLWRHVQYNDSVGIYGWKVLIYNGRSRQAAMEAESLFLQSFPDLAVPTRVVYPEPPDFKTMAGVFRTKEEAYRLQQQIKHVFRYSYLVYVRLENGELD